jgi:uncharacterized protein
MGQPVVHFEMIGSNPARLRDFLNELFGWEFDTGGTVAEAISEPTDYGFIDLLTASDGSGIRGGIGERTPFLGPPRVRVGGYESVAR